MDVIEKFEFRKLEIPKKDSPNIKDQITPLNTIISNQEKKIKRYQTFLVISSVSLLCMLMIGFWGYRRNKDESHLSAPISKKSGDLLTEQQPITKDSIWTENSIIQSDTANTPIYRNYFDSIVFLNDVKGEKIVVSKGVDEYLKKDKIIVKSNNTYYNCFCKDLVKFYEVGNKIP